MKLYRFDQNPPGESFVLSFYCPGCKCGHPFSVPRWSWDGNMEKPTFSPSLVCWPDDPSSRCHCFVRNGKIEFLSDCHHELRGMTVDIPDWEENDYRDDTYKD